jgi:hypothetical protein
MSLDDLTGTTLAICQALLQGMVTTPLRNRREEAVVISCGASSLHPSLPNGPYA